MDSQIERIQLQLPQRSLSSLTFSATDPQALGQWLNSLPKANKVQSAQALDTALDELVRIDLPAAQHWSLIEQFRPVVYFLTNQINKQFLNNAIVFNDEQQKDYDICQHLLGTLLKAYKAVVQSCLNRPSPDSPMAVALHRAVSESASTLLLAFEYYRPVSDNLWYELHSLYRIADAQGFLDFQLDDSETSKARKLSIADQYKRILLLSRSRYNQISSQEIRQVYKALSLWAPHAKLGPAESIRSWFVVNLSADEGLHYATMDPNTATDGMLSLDARLLTSHLKKLSSSITEDKPGALSRRVIEHLALAWGIPAKRKHQRQHTSGQCTTCHGFNAIHYYLSDQKAFDDLVIEHTATATHVGKSAFSSNDSSDAWTEAHDARPADGEKLADNKPETINFQKATDNGPLYPTASCSIINTSASGFCLKLKHTGQKQLRVGELLALQEEGQTQWLLATIRWIQAKGQNELTIGLELLSVAVKPCALTPLKKTMSTSHYQRGFILPVMPFINEQPTIITPRIPFRNGLKFILLHGGKIRKGQLLECVSNTPSYSQFQFRLLESEL